MKKSHKNFFSGSDSQVFACSAGDPGSVPELGRSSGEMNGYTPIFLPGKFHGQRSLTCYSPQGHRVGQDWATNTFTYSHTPVLTVLTPLSPLTTSVFSVSVGVFLSCYIWYYFVIKNFPHHFFFLGGGGNAGLLRLNSVRFYFSVTPVSFLISILLNTLSGQGVFVFFFPPLAKCFPLGLHLSNYCSFYNVSFLFGCFKIASFFWGGVISDAALWSFQVWFSVYLPCLGLIVFLIYKLYFLENLGFSAIISLNIFSVLFSHSSASGILLPNVSLLILGLCWCLRW